MLDITDRDPYLWNILKSCFPKFRDFLFIHRRPRTTWFYTWNISRNLYIYIFERIYSFRAEFNSVKIYSYWISFSPKAIYKKKKSPKQQSPHSLEKLEKKKRKIFYSSFSLPFQISSSNLAETSTSPLPPPFLYLNAQIKSKSFLKIRDLIAQYHCSSGSSLSALIRSQIRAFHCSKIKKPGGIKKPRSKVKIILMPSYLHLRISIVILRK